MFNLLWTIPALPFTGSLILILVGAGLPRKTIAAVGVGSIGISALATLLLGVKFLSSPPDGFAFSQSLWTWMDVGGFKPEIAFRLDALSLVFIFVITFVGFWIHLYSSEFMQDEEGYSRFFAYMNLFVGSMLTLVLADNLLLLYLGWEGVGLCSYLLIGFWYKDPANGAAARKAFIVTRVGDTSMAIGLFLLVKHFSTLNIQSVMQLAGRDWTIGSGVAVATAALLLGGALGKSAQLPLQTWLPDAMAGPSPVSALIHAATMVTAGVYLIARTHVLFELAPVVQTAVAVIGAATLLVAGFSALTQVDIKRTLAYSTISQIGYMFLALGVGAWSAAIFHFVIHAFFKALLFLGAGVVILAMHHEHNMFKMGGLKKHMPVVFWTFLIGSASLASLPLVTAGFYSKDMILWFAWSSTKGSPWLWSAAITGALLTALYTFRMVFVTFYGKEKQHPHYLPGWQMRTPLLVLAVFSIVGGFVELPESLGHVTLFSTLTKSIVPAVEVMSKHTHLELWLQMIASFVALSGVLMAWLFYSKNPQWRDRMAKAGFVSVLRAFFLSGWGFDILYETLFIKPFVWLAHKNRNDAIDWIYTGIVILNRSINGFLSWTQNGRLRWYAMSITLGAIIIVTIVVFI
jgi:NADH-quinone oxidoreductase subunit L